MTTIEAIATFHDDLVTWRRDIHAYPELGFEESRTSEFVADKLASFGLEVQRGIAKTGIVATLQAGTSNRAIGLRADMDALPIQEANDFDHCSHHAGKMHAYGHDGHTTMLLGAARYLAGNPTFDGRVHFIFQPAEEGLGGAKAMIAEGLFDRFPMENIYGMHNSPGMPAGTFAIRPGPMMAGGAFFDIAIDGVGAHGARPEHSVDPVIAASYITTALQTIVARNTKPVDTAVVSVTQIRTGDAYNVIPQTAHMKGTVRAFSRDTMQLIEQRMRDIPTGVGQGLGAGVTVDFRETFAPVVNAPSESEIAADAAADLVGDDNVDRNRSLIMGSEDFSYMLEECPGAYIRIGNGAGEGSCQVHNPAYDFIDDILSLGPSFWSRLGARKLAA